MIVSYRSVNRLRLDIQEKVGRFPDPSSESMGYGMADEEGHIVPIVCVSVPDCGSGPWTLVMKMNGEKVLIIYSIVIIEESSSR